METVKILKRPIVTEKAVKLIEATDKQEWVFMVDKDANKIQIRRAVEEKFNVTVKSVRTLIMPPRVKRRYTKAGIINGKTLAYKKAYVKLETPTELEFYTLLNNAKE